MVSADGETVKITDFNVSKALMSTQQPNVLDDLLLGNNSELLRMHTKTGTLAFTAPEMITDFSYNEKVDIWSAGTILYTMLSGMQPFYSSNIGDLKTMIENGEVDYISEPWPSISKSVISLVRKMLDVDPKKRPSAMAVLDHSWFKQKNQFKIPLLTLSRIAKAQEK